MGKRRIVFGVLLVLWMIMIFMRSAKIADESTIESEYVGRIVGSIVVPDFEKLPEEEQLRFAQNIDHKVRKTAHATEYAVLGVLVFMTAAFGSMKKRILFAWLFSLVYAVSDEIHQTFVPGRSGRVGDVLIDSFGAALGILIISLAVYTLNAKRERSSGKEEKNN